MMKSSYLRVAPSADGVSIWSSDIFGDTEPSRLRDLLSRAFSVGEVQRVELHRASSFGRICYQAAAQPAQIWKKLGQALRQVDAAKGPVAVAGPDLRVDAAAVYLGGPAGSHVHVSRIGRALTTWRVRHESEHTLRLVHPWLRLRRDVVFRLEEELAAILGVEDFRASSLTGAVTVRFDKRALTAEHLARELEKAWPRLLEGVDGPPSRKRFVAATGLLGLAVTGQFFVPAVRPLAVAGVAIYSSPNVVNAAKQLRHGEVGLPALYSTGLALMLIGGMPFSATVFATLMQLWPQLSHGKLVRSQRRLFARARRRPVWARIPQSDGVSVEVSVDQLQKGDLVEVQRGEIVPVDGVVAEGHASVLAPPSFGDDRIEDRVPGDSIAAGALVRDGSLTIRVERTGTQTAASYLASLLPHTKIPAMPSSQEVERIANRNAKPALALAAASLVLSRTLRISQAVIRPDYATAPRVSAELSALQGIARGQQLGVLFRNPAALDRLAGVEVYVFDDGAGLDRRAVEVATIQSVDGVPPELLLGYVLATQGTARGEQTRALAAFASTAKAVDPRPTALRRRAGVTLFKDVLGSEVAVATARYLTLANIDVPKRLQAATARRPKSKKGHSERVQLELVDGDPALRPLYVLRDNVVIGVVSFARSGPLVGKAIVAALKEHNPRARFEFFSRSKEADARALAAKLDLGPSYHAALRPATKVDLVRGLGAKTLWVGDGTAVDAREVMAASTISVSGAALGRAHDDAADILLSRGLSGLPGILELGETHALRLEKDYRTVYLANLLGLTGGYVARFGGLQSGLLSHLGAAIIYGQHARALDKLASSVEARGAQLELLAPASALTHTPGA